MTNNKSTEKINLLKINFSHPLSPKNNKPSNKPFIKNISLLNRSNNRNNSQFPKWEKEGSPGFEGVRITLKEGQKINGDGGAMNFMSGNIAIETKVNGWGKAIMRSLSGSSFFHNTFTCTNGKGYINFSSASPGNVGCFIIPPNKKFKIVSDSYICATTNLNISGNIKTGGFLLGYGLTYVTAESNDGKSGLIWVSSLGDIIETELKPSESIKFDNGVLLALDDTVEFYTVTVGNLYSTFFSSEGLVSEVKNNTGDNIKVYLQGRSRIYYNQHIREIIGPGQKETSSLEGWFK